mmetsp:Transcript_17576/g.32666  ORF Transcript_17576/g.32666 Transcript_17576/m.32666 type:complete len:210 (-) Transcript_17576:1378-2007(-)
MTTERAKGPLFPVEAQPKFSQNGRLRHTAKLIGAVDHLFWTLRELQFRCNHSPLPLMLWKSPLLSQKSVTKHSLSEQYGQDQLTHEAHTTSLPTIPVFGFSTELFPRRPSLLLGLLLSKNSSPSHRNPQSPFVFQSYPSRSPLDDHSPTVCRHSKNVLASTAPPPFPVCLAISAIISRLLMPTGSLMFLAIAVASRSDTCAATLSTSSI